MNTQDAASIGERQKWDDYYATLPMVEIDDATRAFGEDLAARIAELLPPEGKVLEAGCGAGWQSVVLAQAGRRQLTLMDFSAEALNYAKRAFTKYSLAADFVCQDVFTPGEPEYDLVFNAGVLSITASTGRSPSSAEWQAEAENTSSRWFRIGNATGTGCGGCTAAAAANGRLARRRR